LPAWDLTRSDYKQMAALRGQGLTWAVISARLGRSEGTLRVMFSRYQQGQVRAVPSTTDQAVEARCGTVSVHRDPAQPELCGVRSNPSGE